MLKKIAKFFAKPKEKTLLLFLDIDGVLHKANTGHLNLIPNLNQVINEFEKKFSQVKVKIVISSNWKDSFNLSDLKETLLELSDRIIDVTPECSRSEHNQYDKRQKEIEKWLSINSKKFKGDLKFLAIDDDKKIFTTGYPHVFFTENNAGLDAETCEKLRRALDELF